jgi:DNA-binding response OmpR family regulator
MIGAMALTVLVVDDDPSFLALAARIARDMGFENVLTTSDVAAALREAELNRPQAALVDIGLPQEDGIDLAHRLAALAWSPRVVLTSTDRDAITAIPPRHRGRGLPFIPKDELANGRLPGLLLGP